MDIYDINEEDEVPSSNDALELSNIQKNKILDRWNNNKRTPPSIAELLELAFPKQNIDGRSKEASLVKEFLVENGMGLIKQETKKGGLSDEQKEYIKNNNITMKPLEMARALFNNQKLSSASQEVREVSLFLKSINPDEKINIDNYTAPNTIDRTVTRVKKYVNEEKELDAKKLTPNQKKNMEALLSYLSSYRFKYQVDTYEDEKDKELFESSFIKYTYDKNDLTQENCDQYILLCSLIIRGSQIQRNMNLLQREQDRFLEEEGKISMAVVEAIKTAGTESDSCIKMQQNLYKSLTQERSDKLSEEIKDKASLLNLINAWKNYETRQNLLKLAGEKKDKLRKDLHELENLDEMRMRILGLSVEEIVNG